MKSIEQIHQSSAMHWVGDGFPVRSVFDYNGLGLKLSPFLMLDYAAPYPFPPGRAKRGVGAHPHKGFETVTVAYQGELEHRDSSGGGGIIGAGDVQWMTAGKGIIHEEFHSPAFSNQGGTLQMAQLWVNLRAKDKSAPAAYQTLKKEQIPVVGLPDEAGQLRVIAGNFSGQAGAAKTFSPINLWDISLLAGKSVTLPVPDGHTTTFLVLHGSLRINDARDAGEGALVIFNRSGNNISLTAKTDVKLLLMDGEPFDEPIVGHGPFVMNSREEIIQAFHDFEEGRMGDL